MLEITANGKNQYQTETLDGAISVNGKPVVSDIHEDANGLFSVLVDGKSFTAMVDNIDAANKEVSLKVDGQVYKMKISEPIDLLLSKMGFDAKARNKAEAVKAPMPGMVLRILVEPGQAIKKGDGLIVLEAMKMENILKAGADAVVKAIKVSEKTAVEKGTVLIELGS
jgi:biotin carboxyl carrier protein